MSAAPLAPPLAKPRLHIRSLITGPTTVEFRATHNNALLDRFDLHLFTTAMRDRAALEGVIRAYQLHATVEDIRTGAGFPQRDIKPKRDPRTAAEKRAIEDKRRRLLRKLEDAQAKAAQVAREVDEFTATMLAPEKKARPQAVA